MSDEASSHKRQRDRSPSYPGIALETAIERARTFYDKEGRHAAPTSVATEHWGFKAGSGSANVTLAAPIKFGIMETAGKSDARTVRLTDLGLRLVREGNPDQADDLRTAVLMPPIYAELWAHCEREGGIPSDANLRWWLQQKNFTEGAIGEFIPKFKASVRYAGLLESDKVIHDDEQREVETPGIENQRRPDIFSGIFGNLPKMTQVGESLEKKVQAPPSPQVLQFPIPLPDSDQLAGLQVPSRMTESDWAQMLAIINAYKSSIVRSTRREPTEANEAPPDA